MPNTGTERLTEAKNQIDWLRRLLGRLPPDTPIDWGPEGEGPDPIFGWPPRLEAFNCSVLPPIGVRLTIGHAAQLAEAASRNISEALERHVP